MLLKVAMNVLKRTGIVWRIRKESLSVSSCYSYKGNSSDDEMSWYDLDSS